MRWPSLLPLSVVVVAAACSQPASPPASSPATSPAAPSLGIRPAGDEEIKPDMSQVPPDLAKVFDHIDANIDQHVVNLQKWIQQPSISNSGEGIPESAEMVKGFFDELGCQQTQVYDVGITEYGTPGNPVVYAKCDEGAEKTRPHLLDVRHDAGDAARRLAATRRSKRRSSSRRPTRRS